MIRRREARLAAENALRKCKEWEVKLSEPHTLHGIVKWDQDGIILSDHIALKVAMSGWIVKAEPEWVESNSRFRRLYFVHSYDFGERLFEGVCADSHAKARIIQRGYESRVDITRQIKRPIIHLDTITYKHPCALRDRFAAIKLRGVRDSFTTSMPSMGMAVDLIIENDGSADPPSWLIATPAHQEFAPHSACESLRAIADVAGIGFGQRPREQMAVLGNGRETSIRLRDTSSFEGSLHSFVDHSSSESWWTAVCNASALAPETIRKLRAGAAWFSEGGGFLERLFLSRFISLESISTSLYPESEFIVDPENAKALSKRIWETYRDNTPSQGSNRGDVRRLLSRFIGNARRSTEERVRFALDALECASPDLIEHLNRACHIRNQIAHTGDLAEDNDIVDIYHHVTALVEAIVKQALGYSLLPHESSNVTIDILGLMKDEANTKGIKIPWLHEHSSIEGD